MFTQLFYPISDHYLGSDNSYKSYTIYNIILVTSMSLTSYVNIILLIGQ